jgi:hypothetical protein
MLLLCPIALGSWPRQVGNGSQESSLGAGTLPLFQGWKPDEKTNQTANNLKSARAGFGLRPNLSLQVVNA